MRNVSLNQFYHRISKKILVVGGYTEDKQIVQIIQACRLKPLSAFGDNFTYDTTLERMWIDEFNNNIELKDKKPIVNLNCKQIQHTTTDIWRNAPIDFVVAHSTKACVGLFPGSENFILLLMGSDNYFRCYSCQNNELAICSPLIVGLKVLRKFFTEHAKHFKRIAVRSEIKDLHNVEWISFQLPASKLLLPNIITHTKLRNTLYNE